MSNSCKISKPYYNIADRDIVCYKLFRVKYTELSEPFAIKADYYGIYQEKYYYGSIYGTGGTKLYGNRFKEDLSDTNIFNFIPNTYPNKRYLALNKKINKSFIPEYFLNKQNSYCYKYFISIY